MPCLQNIENTARAKGWPKVQCRVFAPVVAQWTSARRTSVSRLGQLTACWFGGVLHLQCFKWSGHHSRSDSDLSVKLGIYRLSRRISPPAGRPPATVLHRGLLAETSERSSGTGFLVMRTAAAKMLLSSYKSWRSQQSPETTSLCSCRHRAAPLYVTNQSYPGPRE